LMTVLAPTLASALAMDRARAGYGVAMPMPGVVTPDDPVVKEVAEFAAQEWGKSANNLEPFAAGRVAHVSVQRASIPNEKDQYALDMEFLGNMGTTRFMHVEVSRAPEGAMELSKSSTLFTIKADEGLNKPQKEDPDPRMVMVGGYNPMDVDDPQLRSAAVELARKRADSTALEEGTPLVVCEASQQVVAGMNYRLTLGMGGCSPNNERFSGRVFMSFEGQFKAALTP